MLHVTAPSEPTDPSAPRSLTPFELGRIKALAAALLSGWTYARRTRRRYGPS
jgi:hypothetical protein